jgi:hypothetical protein
VILAGDAIPPILQAALARTGATTGFAPLAEAVRADLTPRADAVVIIVPDNTGPIAGPLRVLFDRLAEHPRATLVMRGDGTAAPPLHHPAMLPVAFAPTGDEHDLTGRLSTMLQMRPSLDSLHRNLLHQRRSGESLARRYVNQLRLASQVQRGFLPETLPRFGAFSFEALFRPVDYVSGDIYDVHQLDEEHVGIALADATGHGIPAALLTVYIKRALRGKEVERGTYRLLPPGEVLARLNADLLDAQLTECPFVAAVYAVLNTRTGQLTLARGGAPHPIQRSANGDTNLIESQGNVVGVLPDSRFEEITVALEPGDAVLLYSDGLERIAAPEGTARDIPAGLRRAARRLVRARAVLEAGTGASTSELGGVATATMERDIPPATTRAMTTTPGAKLSGSEFITESAWFELLAREGVSAALEWAGGRQRALRRMGYPLDDLTVLAIRRGE